MEATKYDSPKGELVFWRCCVAQVPLMVLAVTASLLFLLMSACAAVSFALDAWRRDGED